MTVQRKFSKKKKRFQNTLLQHTKLTDMQINLKLSGMYKDFFSFFKIYCRYNIFQMYVIAMEEINMVQYTCSYKMFCDIE